MAQAEASNRPATSAMSPFLKGLGLTGVVGNFAGSHRVAVKSRERVWSWATWATALTIILALVGSLSV
jgi:hypothetical protein